MLKEQKKGGVSVYHTDLRLTLAQPPCGKNCPKRAWDCHVRGKCKEYDEFVNECAELRRRRDLENDVNGAVSDAVGRFPGERRV